MGAGRARVLRVRVGVARRAVGARPAAVRVVRVAREGRGMIVTIEWERMERRRTSLDVPDDATSEQIGLLAAQEINRGRAGRMDVILKTALGHMGWTAPDGRFGGQVR